VFPRQRRHVLYFLEHAREYHRCFIDTEVDMSAVKHARTQHRARGEHVGTVAILAKATALAIRKHPEANVVIDHGLFPRARQLDSIDCKIVVDRELAMVRSVAGAIVPGADGMALGAIQQTIERYRHEPADSIPELRQLLAFQRLPVWLGRILHRTASKSLRMRAKMEGSYALTSVGHQPVTAAYPAIANTLSFVAGGIFDRVVARDGQPAVRPMMQLTLAFDHAAMDASLAMEVLCEARRLLETWSCVT
jgi:pyruvate/2-oxoglutarate dehydrogenase complex dihydrolipoamide acyltransferase (E2) component